MQNSKFQPTISHSSPWGTVKLPGSDILNNSGNSGSSSGSGQSGKWTSDNTNEAIKAGGGILSSLLDIFKPADQNTTYVVSGDGNNNNPKDNTMLYVGIGGVVLVVILFAVIALKK